MKDKKKILISLIILLLVVIMIVVFYNRDKLSNKIDINYDASQDVVDFSNYDNENISLSGKDDLTIDKGGVYTLTGDLDGMITVDVVEEDVQLILDNVNITSSVGPCILVNSVKNLYIVLEGESTLVDASTYYLDDDDVSGVIFSKDDLIIDGDGTLNIIANYGDGIVSKDDLTIKNGIFNITSADDGIRGKDSLVIIDGVFNLTSEGDGLKSTNDTDDTKGYILIEGGNINIVSMLDAIQAETLVKVTGGTLNLTSGNGSSVTSSHNSWGYWGNSQTQESAKGIKSGNTIHLENATITIDSSDDAIHSNNVVEILSGTINASSGDDGIHADSEITLEKATINIAKSYEGIESNKIIINSGTINITASDDGINVNGGNDGSAGGRPGANNHAQTTTSNVYLQINGGEIRVNAAGDGLDSNGNIIMTGGSVYVDGPENSGNGALDYAGEFQMNGGTLIAIGSSGMAQNISSSSSQYGVLINLSKTYSSNTKINIPGIIDYVSSKSFNSIVVSTKNLEKNKTYTLNLDGSAYESFTVTSIATNIGQSMMRR